MCSVTKVKNGSVFPAICHTRHLSRHALITFYNASRAGGVQWLKLIAIGTHIILAEGT